MAKMDEAKRKRVRAGRLMLAGKTPAEAARSVGVARQTAYTWKARLNEGGIDALRSMVTGRPAQLDAGQFTALRGALLPSYYGSIDVARRCAVANFHARAQRWPMGVAFVVTGILALLALTGLRSLWRGVTRAVRWAHMRVGRPRLANPG